MTRNLLLLFACTIFIGCATQTALLRQLEPTQSASLPRRLAVLDVAGDEDRAPLVQSTLMKRLGELGFYTLIDESELQSVSREPLRNSSRKLNMPGTLSAARQLGVDALLITSLKLTETGKTLYGSISLPIGDRQITARVQYELINARSGATLEQGSVASDMYQGKLQSDGTGNSNPAMVFAGMTSQATNRLAQRLAPHTSEVEVRLAEKILSPGSEEVHRGNQAARRGNWDRALDEWTAALERDPRNDAAWYNLGLAFDAMQQYARAKQAYERALRIQDRSLYRQGLERSERAAGQYHLAMAQRINSRGVGPPTDTRLVQRSTFPTTPQAPPELALGESASWPVDGPAFETARVGGPAQPQPTVVGGWPTDLPQTSSVDSAPVQPESSGADRLLQSDTPNNSSREAPAVQATRPSGASRDSAFIPVAR